MIRSASFTIHAFDLKRDRERRRQKAVERVYEAARAPLSTIHDPEERRDFARSLIDAAADIALTECGAHEAECRLAKVAGKVGEGRERGLRPRVEA